MKKICENECSKDVKKSVERAYKTQMKFEFYKRMTELFAEAVNEYIDKENEYTNAQNRIVKFIWDYISKKI